MTAVKAEMGSGELSKNLDVETRQSLNRARRSCLAIRNACWPDGQQAFAVGLHYVLPHCDELQLGQTEVCFELLM